MDRWAEWLAERRFGGDPETRRRVLNELNQRRDTVLDLARLAEGETLLDVGCGEGLIAFGALERGAGRVIFTDVSNDLLALCRDRARDLDVLRRCQFVQTPADALHPIADASVDVVTTRPTTSPTGATSSGRCRCSLRRIAHGSAPPRACTCTSKRSCTGSARSRR
jgi:arsenite methyltransferase